MLDGDVVSKALRNDGRAMGRVSKMGGPKRENEKPPKESKEKDKPEKETKELPEKPPKDKFEGEGRIADFAAARPVTGQVIGDHRHFITPELRPDLFRGALTNEQKQH